jgi:hypothetical protein
VSGLLRDVDALYESAVMDPDAMSQQAITDWFEGIAATTDLDKQTAKLLRRLVRTVQKLATFWAADARLGDLSLGWRTRVDIALGPRAWRPVLDLSQHLLEVGPSEEIYASVADLFRVVNGESWAEGLTYDAWLEDTGPI